MTAISYLQQRLRLARRQKQHRLAQGRLTTAEAAGRLSVEGHIPLAAVPGLTSNPFVAIPAGDPGHLLLVAPPDSGWREHLAVTLAQWPAAALVVDPGGYLYQQTGYLRDTTWGQVYAIPGYRFNLARYCRFWDADAASRLLSFLMAPVPAAEEWRLAHLVTLVQALGCYSLHHRCDPLQLLLDAAYTNLMQVLAGLETVAPAAYEVRRFTKGLPAWSVFNDPDVVRAFALFSRQMQRYQRLYASFTVETAADILPGNWIQQKGSLYLTIPPAELSELSGLAAALVDGVVRYHFSHGRYERLLLVLDATLARWLPPMAQLLVEAAAYGITVVLTAHSLQTLNALDSEADGAALAGRFAHQVWYPPHDWQTAGHMAWLYGTRIAEQDGSQKPAVTPGEWLAWPRDQVLVYTRRERPYRFLADRVTMPEDLPVRPAPVPPRPAPKPRDYLDWLPLHLSLTRSPKELFEGLLLPEGIQTAVDAEPAGREPDPARTNVKTRSKTLTAADGVQASLPLFAAAGDETTGPEGQTAPPRRSGRTGLR